MRGRLLLRDRFGLDAGAPVQQESLERAVVVASALPLRTEFGNVILLGFRTRQDILKSEHVDLVKRCKVVTVLGD